MTRQTEVEKLVGGPGLRNGATIWEDGSLIKAMRQPGTVILIDELTFAPAGVQAIIQLVADDHRSITLDTGEVVKAADGVVFVVADNTTGSGDEGGLYAGTNISNAALVTRFKRMIVVDYLSAQKEAEALANHTACPLPAAKHLADFVAQARRLPALQGVVVSLRQMVGFVQCVQDGFSSKDAFMTTISSRMPATEKAAIEALADLAWNASFEALVHSKPVPAQPSNSPAAKAFGDEVY
jgi:MoxR-like ATPase